LIKHKRIYTNKTQ